MTKAVETDWETLVRVWMHDPVDKALDIRGHVARARRYASVALGRQDGQTPDRDEGLADQLAAIAERMPMPTAGPDGERAVGPENGSLEIRHTLSGDAEMLDCPALDEAAVIETIEDIVRNLDSPKQRFLALWRLLPERIGAPLNRLPADTRNPDHSLIDHADITASLWEGVERGAEGRAILGFALGPVQPFIEAARSLRDLWSGSAILSLLAFAAMRPVFERLGPTAFVFPALRGNALVDLWLRDKAGTACVPRPESSSLLNPSLPHRFVASVPWGRDGACAREFADLCRRSAQRQWREISRSVHEALSSRMHDSGWDRYWTSQCEAVFDFHTTVVHERDLEDRKMARWLGEERFEGVWRDAAKVRRLADAIPPAARPGYDQKSAGRWQAQMEVSARIMEAQRTVRRVPVMVKRPAAERVPPKCTLFGAFEQAGPAESSAAAAFWKEACERWQFDGVRLRTGERLCAVGLTKRFAGPLALVEELGLKPDDLRFPDTATLAAAEWLGRSEIFPEDHREWNGRWLHDTDASLEEDGEKGAPPDLRRRLVSARKCYGRPPVYFAVLKMDGDDLGGWLRGEKSPRIREVMHQKLMRWFEDLDDDAVTQALDAKRPVGPALHAAVSGALGRFASQHAPDIVERHRGVVIYSGGDDLLALLPAARAVICARDLRNAYREGCGRDAPAMGSKATISAGLAWVHFKEDLRLALRAAREAERQAKKSGRNALAMRFMRRSGEHAAALLGWDDADWFVDLTNSFDDAASDRWAYRLRGDAAVLADLPDAAVEAEIRRLADKAAAPRTDGDETPGGRIALMWRTYRDARRCRAKANGAPEDPSDWLFDFTKLCQGASFVARGRDD
ncbi:type III-B CRISPR-associated protein Cas10/Cmr2 [Nitratireductor sp. XY-223]|uniref:type III-B CRISPR-associated protein Cas10/Cmr2 n=1 Tax=Nitratireductor sp. XY-223 TaxID=2561926 RepID=UPI00145BCC47|nr:type III-B CRISPR-associated protein Cas10/Cmr2 [Nitratireductor sp. XY-223]